MASFDIVVCGAGPYGTFSALLLARAGHRVALIDASPSPLESFSHGLGAFWPSPNDPPTRAVVAHGREVALYLNDFCAHGIEVLESDIAPLLGVDRTSTGVLLKKVFPVRFGAQEFERKELDLAVSEGLGLSRSGPGAAFIESRQAAALVDVRDFRRRAEQALANLGVTPLFGRRIRALDETTKDVRIQFDTGGDARGEMAVLGLSSQLGALLPNFADVFVPMSDVRMRYEGPVPEEFAGQDEGVFLFRLGSGHVAVSAVVQGDKMEVLATGPKFLLPGAGAGQRLTTNDLTGDLRGRLESFHRDHVFPFLTARRDGKQSTAPVNLTLRETTVSVDCLPCDELPVLGDFGRQGKVIGTAGWIASGYAASAQAARITENLVRTGKSAALHERLLPRRLLSLS